MCPNAEWLEGYLIADTELWISGALRVETSIVVFRLCYDRPSIPLFRTHCMDSELKTQHVDDALPKAWNT